VLDSYVLNRIGHEVFPRGSVHLFSIQFLTFFLVLFDFVNEHLSVLLVILLLVDLSFSVAHCVYYSNRYFFICWIDTHRQVLGHLALRLCMSLTLGDIVAVEQTGKWRVLLG
jgi:hypothetical protein